MLSKHTIVQQLRLFGDELASACCSEAPAGHCHINVGRGSFTP